MMVTNATPGSTAARQFTWCPLSEEEMFSGIDQRMQGHRGGSARSPLKDLAVGEASDGCQNHVPPVGQGLRPVVQVRASKKDRGSDEDRGGSAKFLHHPVLDEGTEQDFFRQCSGHEDEAEGFRGSLWREISGNMKRRNESERDAHEDEDGCDDHETDQRIYKVHEPVRQVVLHALHSAESEEQNQRQRERDSVCDGGQETLRVPGNPPSTEIQLDGQPEQ